jgi:hypothetical protein
MRRARKRGRQLCAGIAACRAELRSGEKNTVPEVGPYEIGTYEIGTWAVDLVTPSFASHEFAGAQQQGTCPPK